MGILSGLKKVIKNPFYIIPILNTFHLLNWMPDDIFLKLRYRAYMGQRLDLKNPTRFTEKLQWLKLNGRKPEYSRLVDKFAVREHIAEQFGEKYLIPLLGVWDSVNEIDFSELPDQFVLKCTHDSGGIAICTDKRFFDVDSARKKLGKRLKHNYFWLCREYPYKNVKPRIICEQFMVDESGSELKDYKVFCFNGNPKFILVDFNRMTRHSRNTYNMAWQLQSFVMNRYYPDPSTEFSKPVCLDEMLSIAAKISEDYPFLRVDFYVIDDRLYIGEITFFPAAGLLIFEPPEFDSELGALIKLPNDNIN